MQHGIDNFEPAQFTGTCIGGPLGGTVGRFTVNSPILICDVGAYRRHQYRWLELDGQCYWLNIGYHADGKFESESDLFNTAKDATVCSDPECVKQTFVIKANENNDDSALDLVVCTCELREHITRALCKNSTFYGRDPSTITFGQNVTNRPPRVGSTAARLHYLT